MSVEGCVSCNNLALRCAEQTISLSPAGCTAVRQVHVTTPSVNMLIRQLLHTAGNCVTEAN